MPDITVTISNIEQTLLRHVMLDPLEWLRNAIRNRARHAADFVIREQTTTNPDKLTDQEKIEILRTLDLPPHTPNPDD